MHSLVSLPPSNVFDEHRTGRSISAEYPTFASGANSSIPHSPQPISPHYSLLSKSISHDFLRITDNHKTIDQKHQENTPVSSNGTLPDPPTLENRAYSLNATDSMPRFMLNSIELYILHQNISEIEFKLSENERYQMMMRAATSKKSSSSASLRSLNSNENVSLPKSLSPAMVYGLKRQLAMLKARLRKEERMLIELQTRIENGEIDMDSAVRMLRDRT
jgi:hypothetical protein